MNEKRTVLSDSLESELTKRSSDSAWRFQVRETTCENDDCNCELVAVSWFGAPPGVGCSQHPDDPLIKAWTVEEVNRRKSMGDFAQAILDQLVSDGED